MAIEIERKFLVINDTWRSDNPVGIRCLQGYITFGTQKIVRVRAYGEKGFLAVKASTKGLSRLEYEYEIPLADALEMLKRLCRKSVIEKTRYIVIFAARRWEIDVFSGANKGLVLAEIELGDEQELFLKPPWLGPEVTKDRRYLNCVLSRRPRGNPTSIPENNPSEFRDGRKQ